MTGWEQDEAVDYSVESVLWAVNDEGDVPRHQRIVLHCSACGRLLAFPQRMDAGELVAEIELHHCEKHGGPDYRADWTKPKT